jgi:hypothetical protein
MRRIVVEMGYWLSPMLKDHPLPVLSEWERTVDLTALHNRPAWHPTKLDQGKSVLERLDTHMPRKSVASMAPPSKQVGTNLCRHDHNANRRALMSYERMTDAEREALERRKEENRKQEVAEKQARMKQTEVELREVMTEEEQAERQAKREKAMAAVRAERAREAELAEAEAERRRQRAEKERQRKREARALKSAQKAKTEMTEEEKAEHKAELARQRKRAQRERVKASKPVVELMAGKERPPVDLSHASGITALEAARQIPLHDLMEKYLGRKMSIARNRAARKGETINEAAAYAVEVERLDGHINKNPDFLYEDRARVIAHDRANGIIERELRRGSILPEEAAAYRLKLSPFGERREQLALMTEEDRRQERLAKKRERRAAAKGRA